MSKRLRTHAKNKRIETPNLSTAPTQEMFQSRPMQVLPHSATQSQQQQDLKTSLLRALRYGHRLQRIHPAEQSAPAKAPQVLQAKLTVGAPGDVYEQEADAVAAMVVNQINEGGERSPAQEPAPSQYGQRRKKKKASLPLVKVHTDAQSDRLNRSLNAHAFTTGQDIFFKQEEYKPGTRRGQKLLAHELTHVMQQNTPAIQCMDNETSPPSESFQDPKAQAQRDYLLNDRLKGDVERMEQLLRGMKTKAAKRGTTVEQLLIEQYEERQRKQQQKTPFGQYIQQVTQLQEKAQALLVELDSQKQITGMSKLIRSVKGELNGPVKKMLAGELEATKERFEGAQNNIESTEAEWESAKGREGLTELGKEAPYMPEGGSKETYVDVDVVAEEGKLWVEVKNYKPFNKDSKTFHEIKEQLQKLLNSAEQNPVEGVNPRVILHFTKGVYLDVRKAYEELLGAGNVEGEELNAEVTSSK